MALQPTFTPIKPEWRGSSSSADMNSNFEEILYDLNVIFEEASSQAIELDELRSTLKHEVDALTARLYAVSGMLAAWETSASGYKMCHEEFYRTRNVVYPAHVTTADRCYVDTDFGFATLPVSNSFSKVYTTSISTGEIYQSPDLDVTITPIDETGNLRIDETNNKRCFNGNNQSFWERKVRFSRDYAKADVRCKMDITLPSMSNPNVNAFYMFPYPEGTVDVTEITYDTLTSQNNVLPTFPAAGEENINRSKYLFNDIQPTSFTIKFKQDTNAVEDNYKTFTYGAQEIGIEKVEYKPTGKVGVKFELPSYDTGLFSKITSLTTSPSYDNIKTKVYLYTSLSDFDANSPEWSSTSSAITPTNQLDVAIYATDVIYIMVEIIQESGTTSTPKVDSVTMTYTTA